MSVALILSEVQHATLVKACDTLVPQIHDQDDPHGFWARAASDLGVPGAIEERLAGNVREDQAGALRELLDGLAEEGFNEATQEERERMLHAVADSSPSGLARVDALTRRTMMLFYAMTDADNGRNPNWEAIGYPGPRAEPPDEPKAFAPIRPRGDITLEADVCVVGSGCGGGVIAGKLATEGREQVVVLEMGGYYNEADFNQRELWAYEHLYLGHGPFPTNDGQVSIQAGSTFGGGSTVNWMNCLRTPRWVREEWEAEHGLEGLGGADYERHLDAVWERIGVTDRCSDLNGPHQRLKDACEKLGYDFRRVNRNVDPSTYDPEVSGYLGFGDQSGSKQSTPKTYLADARTGGAEFVVDCFAERILVEDGRAAGVEATYRDPECGTARVVVRAPRVVVAAGSMESPALLLRSGIGGPAVGQYLRLQPATVMYGVYEEPQDWWWGPPQAGLSLEFANVEDGHGFLLESPHSTTGTTASRLPWRSGLHHKTLMANFDRLAPFVCLIRDRGHGQVSTDRFGNAVHQYRMTDELDVRNFRRGLGKLVKLHEAAGAREIVALGRKVKPWQRGDSVDAFIDELRRTSLEPNEFAVLSGHQMGSCRMGSDPRTSVANPWGELHDAQGVWIGDASAFPSAPGTNPMITTMALAHRTAEAMAAA